MAGDLLYFIHRHFRVFMTGAMAVMVGGLGLLGMTVKTILIG